MLRHVWELLTSKEGLAVWLGAGAVLDSAKGSTYKNADGTTGEVRSFHEHDRIRLTLRPADWSHDTTLQVAVRIQRRQDDAAVPQGVAGGCG